MPSRFCIYYVSKSGRHSSGPKTGKCQSSSRFPRSVVPKNELTIRQSHSSPLLWRSRLKSCMLGLQHYVNRELPGVQPGFRKGRGTRDQSANIHWIIEQAGNFRKQKTKNKKNTYLCFIDYAKAFDCVDHDKLWKALRWEYQTILPVSWETCMRVKKQQLESCMEQLIGSRSRKEHGRAVCCHPVCLICTLGTSWEMPGWMIYKLEL